MKIEEIAFSRRPCTLLAFLDHARNWIRPRWVRVEPIKGDNFSSIYFTSKVLPIHLPCIPISQKVIYHFTFRPKFIRKTNYHKMGYFSQVYVVLVLALCLGLTSPSFAVDTKGIDSSTRQEFDKQSLYEGVINAVRKNGCDTNLCFALQGGDRVNNNQYGLQINFVDIVMNIITVDKPANYAAVQYHSSTTGISQLVNSKKTFVERLHKSKRIAGGNNIAAGMRFCTKQLSPHRGDANKLVVLGNGFAKVTKDQVQAAKQFFRSGGSVCAVAVGKANRKGLKKLTRSNARIVNITGFFKLSEIVVDFVHQVCNLPK